MTTPASSRILVVTLIVSLLAPSLAQAQQTSQGYKTPDTRLQDLIDSRKSEYWNFWETQLALTPAPRSQPIEALPEWHPTSSVILTLDDDYIRSFVLNKALRMESKGAEIIRHDPSAINHIRSITCNTLDGVESEATELLRHDPEVSARIKETCQGLPESQRKGLTIDAETPEYASLLAYVWLERLREDEVLNVLSYAHTLLKIMGDLSTQTDVVVLVPGSGQDEDAIHDTIELIKSFPNGAALLNSSRIQFVQVAVRTKWVRDYGPIFVKGADGKIICVDPRYETNRQSLEQRRELARMKDIIGTVLKRQAQQKKEETEKTEETGEEETEEQDEVSAYRETRLFDDVSPSLLAARLRQRNKDSLLPYPINVVRPPLALDGGDFFTDGRGVGFTSTKTLQSNGGNIELINEVFKEYFGIKEVVYLQPLPGSTVKHIDMFFKPVTDRILLLGKYEGLGGGAYGPNLQAEAQRVLAYNLRVLKDFYRNRKEQDQPTEVNVVDKDTDEIKSNMVNIVLVPMPDLQRPIREKLDKTQQELTRLRKKYDQESKAFRNVESKYKSLDDTMEYFTYVVERLNQAIVELRTPPTEDPITLSYLLRLASVTVLHVEASSEEPAQSSDETSTSPQLKPLGDLKKFVESKDEDVELTDLSDTDKGTLAPLLRSAVASVRSLLPKIVDDRAKAREDYLGHLQDLTQIKDEFTVISEQFEKLQHLFPQGSDLYRTFLNALQVRTNQANLLLMPVYRGMDQLEQRVEKTLRRVYTHAYGNVTIIPVDSDYFIQLSGSIHCLTQTIPTEVEVFPDDWNYRSKLAVKP